MQSLSTRLGLAGRSRSGAGLVDVDEARGVMGRLWLRLPSRLRRRIVRFDLDEVSLPRGAELALGALFLGSSLVYAAALGGELDAAKGAVVRVAEETTSALGFSITAVKLSGQRESDEETILAYLGVTPASSLLVFNAEAARQRIASISWVRTAAVQKLYPGTLVVTMTERQPFAVWQHDGALSIIDESGRVIDDGSPERFAHLPIVVGKGAERRAATLLAEIAAHPAVAEGLKAAVRVAERRWNLVLANGIEVKLPEEGVAEALARLDRLDREDRILAKDIAAVDLRFADRVVVRLSEAAIARRAEGGKAGTTKRRGSDT